MDPVDSLALPANNPIPVLQEGAQEVVQSLLKHVSRPVASMGSETLTQDVWLYSIVTFQSAIRNPTMVGMKFSEGLAHPVSRIAYCFPDFLINLVTDRGAACGARRHVGKHIMYKAPNPLGVKCLSATIAEAFPRTSIRLPSSRRAAFACRYRIRAFSSIERSSAVTELLLAWGIGMRGPSGRFREAPSSGCVSELSRSGDVRSRNSGKLVVSDAPTSCPGRDHTLFDQTHRRQQISDDARQ